MNNTGWECPRCHQVHAPHVPSCPCPTVPDSLRERLGTNGITWPVSTPRFDPSKCPCQPQNGGSGICGCIMSGPTITC